MKNITIIGISAAGVAAIEAIRKKDKQSKITVISDEEVPAYCRCVISDYLARKVGEEKLAYRGKDFFTTNKVDLKLNTKVIKVDPKKKRVVAEIPKEVDEDSKKKSSNVEKIQFDYDVLLLANGASPKFPDTKGIKKKGVLGFRTIKDARTMIESSAIADTACVLGGGMIGLKAASGLSKRGMDVKVIIRSPHVLSQVLDSQAAEFFQKRISNNRIEIITGASVSEIVGNGDVKAVRLDSGKVVACQMVVVAKGVEPNIKILKDIDIKIDEGVCVDETMKTSIDNIYAAGDVCQAYDIALDKPWVNALWPNAVEQGKIAGSNIAGENIAYEGGIGMNSVEFFGLPMVSMGVYKENDNHEVMTKIRPEKEEYKKLVIEENRLVGAILVGEIAQAGVFLRLIREKTDISSIKDKLMHENFGYPNIKELVKEEDKIYV